TYANPSRLLWWAQFGLSDLPVDFVETSVDGAGLLPVERYAKLLCEHQLTIGLTRRANGINILTGRTLETLLMGGVLVEEDSVDARYFLKPGAHYIPFESWADLRELVPWLLANPGYRERLARDGQAWTRRHFTGDWFWAGLLDRLYSA
ncbi:MAG: glycosyltransferase family 1 protein, partial [Alphaproteobacteria bacterium]|nr:glycosyltransferase family 1 protein [Alphaproteobacteria bacterium]